MSEAITLKKTLVAAAAAALAGGAPAAELGSLTVFSAVGQALDAELSIRDVDAQADKVMVRLAPESTYRRVGKQVAVPLSDLTISLLRKDPYTVKIAGKQPVGVDRFPLIVELNEGGKVSAKLYEIRLKAQPSASMTKVGSSAETPAQKAPDTLAAPKTETAASAAAPRRSAPIPSAVPSAGNTPSQGTPEPAYVPPVREPASALEKAPVKPAAKPASAASGKANVKLPLNPADYDLDQPFLVQDGMTMWSIATLYRSRYPQACMDQILVAFVRANPSAYERGRVSGVKVGSRLKAPLADEVASVGIDEAWAIVRLAPGADARKAPSAKLLARAHARMPKQAPALWRRYKEQQPKAATPVKPEPKEQLQPEPKAEIVKTQAPTPAPEPKTEEPAPSAAASAAALSDPLAGTIAQAEADHNAKISAPQTEPATAEPSAPAAEPAPEPTPVPAMPALEEEGEGASGGFWGMLLGIVVVLGAAAGGFWYWMKKRAAAHRREENLGVIKFRKTQAADAEQLKGASEMLERRLESERATERMQQVQKAERIEPELGEVKTSGVAQKPAQEATEQEQSKPRASGFNVASAYVDEESAPRNEAPAAVEAPAAADAAAPAAPAPTVDLSAEVLAGKLITARTYMSLGAYAEAKCSLHEVMIAGSQEQRRQAAEMLAQIERLTNK